MQPVIELVNAAAGGGPGWRMTMPLRDGDIGVIDTIECCRALAIEAAAHSKHVERLAAAAQSSGAPIDFIYRTLQRGIRRVDDPDGVELLEHPDVHLPSILSGGQSAGDCDDHAVIGVAVLDRLGIPAAFCVANIEGEGKPFTHVFYAAKLGGQWQPIDSQERIPPGYFAAKMRRFALIPLR